MCFKDFSASCLDKTFSVEKRVTADFIYNVMMMDSSFNKRTVVDKQQ